MGTGPVARNLIHDTLVPARLRQRIGIAAAVESEAVWSMLGIPEWAIGVVVIILTIAGSVLIVHWIRPEIARPDPKSRVTDSTEHGQTLEDAQGRLGELDQLKQRMSELEERVDFAERLLAKQREGPRLGPAQAP